MENKMTIEEARRIIKDYIKHSSQCITPFGYFIKGKVEGFIEGYESQEKRIAEFSEENRQIKNSHVSPLTLAGTIRSYENRIEQLEQMVDDSVTGKRIRELEAYQTDQDCAAVIFRDRKIKSLQEAGEELKETIEDLIGTAESYAMQTYDRQGVTRKSIAKAHVALAQWEKASKEGK
jgi:hypothetical protein